MQLTNRLFFKLSRLIVPVRVGKRNVFCNLQNQTARFFNLVVWEGIYLLLQLLYRFLLLHFYVWAQNYQYQLRCSIQIEWFNCEI